MASLQEAYNCLDRAIAEYNAARSIPAVEMAILAMQTGVEAAFRAYLENVHLPGDTREALQTQGAVNFFQLVDLVGDHTDVLGADLRTRPLLVSLNKNRNRLAHPLDKPTPEQIVQDAGRWTELITLFWPRLFPGTQPPRVTPVTLEMLQGGAPQPGPRATPPPSPPPRPPTLPEHRERQPPPPPPPTLLQSLWRGEIKPRRWFWRLFGALVFAGGASFVWGLALSLALQPQPLKLVSVVLALLAIGLLVGSAWLLWRLFRLLGLRRVLIVLSVLYLAVVLVRVLITAEDRSLADKMLHHSTGVARGAWGAVVALGRSLVEAPGTFTSAYTRRGERIDVPDVEKDSTPVHGKAVEPLVPTQRGKPAGTPRTPTPTPTPSRPTAGGEIQVGEYVEVRGTRGETLRARSGAGTDHAIVTRFGDGARLLVLEGPTEADGYAWWKVRGDGVEGWCADRWLAPVE